MSHPVVNKTDPTGYKYSFFGQAYATNKNKNDMRMPRRKNEKFPEEDIGKFTEKDGSSRKALNSDSSKKETNKGPEVHINSFKKNIRSKYKESNKKGKKSEIEEDQKIEDEKIEDKKINDQNNQNIENIKSGTGTTTIKNKINDGDSYNRGLIPMPTSEREKINNEIKKSLFEGPYEKKIGDNENNSNNEKSLNKQMEELKSYKTDAKKHGEVPFTGVENLDDIANDIKIFKSEQKNTNKKLLKSNSIGGKKKGKHNAPLSERKMTLLELIKNTESAQEIPIGDFLDNKRGLSENNKLSQSYADKPYTYTDERGIVNIDIKMSKLSHKNTKKIQNNKNTKEIQNSKSYNIIDELRQIKRRHSEKIETTKTKTTQVTPYHRKKVFAKPGFNFASQSGEHNEFNKYYSFSEIKGGNNKLINMGLIVEEAEEDDKENISDAYKYNTQPYNTQTYTQSARPYVRKINSKLFTKNTYGNAKLDYNVNIPNKNTNILGSKGNIFLDLNEDDDKNRIFTEVPTNVEERNTENVSTNFLPQSKSKSRSRNNIENKKDDIENEMDINNIKIEKEIASNNNIFSSFSNNNAQKKLELTNEPENNKDEANNNLNNISMSEINNNNAENLNNDSGFFSENKSEIKNIEIEEEIKNKNMLTNMLTNNPEEKVNNNKEENNDKPKDSMVNPYKNNNNNEGEANNNLNNMNILNINAPKIDNLFTAQNSFTDVVKNKRKGERSNIDNLLDSIDNDSKKDMNAGENTNNIINEKLNTQNPLNTNPLLESASLIKNLNNQNNDSKNNIKIEEEKEIKEEKKDEIKEE
ncbi:MAG: hypothetical protein IJ853_03315, partial [Rickettsiales bacterium]|nr:hypothetical protein [Rickettsiales bacterium]